MPAPKKPNTRLGNAIRAARKSQEMHRQQQLADAMTRAGITCGQDTISDWETGDRVPDRDQLFALGVVLNQLDRLVEAWRADGDEHAATLVPSPSSEGDDAGPGWMCLRHLAAISRAASRTLVPSPTPQLKYA